MNSSLLRKRLLLLLVLLVLVAGAVEALLWVRFYSDVSSARNALLQLRSELDLETLKTSSDRAEELEASLTGAENRLSSARAHVDRDPVLLFLRLLPGAKTQAQGLRQLVKSAEASAKTGLAATSVLKAYTLQDDQPGQTAVQEGIQFLRGQAQPMASVRASIDGLKQLRQDIPGGMIGPLEKAVTDLDEAIVKLDALATGYERANALLPDILGFNGRRTYLILPQNDTELFPSGGLISNYGVAVFDEGRVAEMEFEYFVNLYDRWQRQSGGEYIEPPLPLKNYLLRHISWALGEAGWFPDFPTTAELATSFVQKGGAPPLEGSIAIDLQFVEALLRLLGPTTVSEPGLNVTVTAENISEVTLEQTRNESTVPGAPGKSFLGSLARVMLNRIFATSKDEWIDLIQLLDQMARERHLQLHFWDPRIQALNKEYGFDGGLKVPQSDFLLLADTSVNSTKLNLILKTSIEVAVFIQPDRSVQTRVTYSITNPFDSWRQGRDPRLVQGLMLSGVYGSYTRVYAHPRAQFIDVQLDGQSVGAEQIGSEVGKAVFGRFFPVLPGQSRSVSFTYHTPGLVASDGTSRTYELYVQKEAGTRAIPLKLMIQLPEGAVGEEFSLDGQRVRTEQPIVTDLQTDRVVGVSFDWKRR